MEASFHPANEGSLVCCSWDGFTAGEKQSLGGGRKGEEQGEMGSGRKGGKQAKFSSWKRTLTGLAGGSSSTAVCTCGRGEQYETHVWIKAAGHGLCYSCHSTRPLTPSAMQKQFWRYRTEPFERADPGCSSSSPAQPAHAASSHTGSGQADFPKLNNVCHCLGAEQGGWQQVGKGFPLPEPYLKHRTAHRSQCICEAAFIAIQSPLP